MNEGHKMNANILYKINLINLYIYTGSNFMKHSLTY